MWSRCDVTGRVCRHGNMSRGGVVLVLRTWGLRPLDVTRQVNALGDMSLKWVIDRGFGA